MLRRPLLAGIGVLTVLVGIVWAGQGLGLIGGSSMTNDPTWLWIGLVVIVVGVVLLVISRHDHSGDLNGPPGQH